MRREYRVAGQAEPISHFTDAVEANGLLFVSGIVPVDERRELVGGDDVVAQARCVFDNMRAVLAAAGCTFADVVKVTVFLTDVDDRPLDQPGAAGGVRRHAPGLDARRDLGARDPRCEDRGRVRGGDAVVSTIRTTPRSPGSTSRCAVRRTGPLAGRTVLVKDLIDTAGMRTTYGSRIYGDHVPDAHATVVQRVLDAGGAVVGKANLPEFAWSVLGANPWYGTVRNPAHPGKTTGGSSSGNAAALAGGLADLGIGSDTGCSIRLPSAACETVGLKSQWGLIPLDGIFPLVPSLDTVGPMARTRRRRRRCSGRCCPAAPCPSRGSTGSRSGCSGRPPYLGDGRETEHERRRRAVGGRAGAARRAGRRGGDPGRGGEHVAALPPRGGPQPSRRPSPRARTSTRT